MEKERGVSGWREKGEGEEGLVNECVYGWEE